MPALTSGKVLVTGANGYIATWVTKALLDHGFSVRGTVRSESKASNVRSLFAPFENKFEVTIVEDITKDGAFDEAVKGIDAIAHIASPVSFSDTAEPNEVIEPALRGTTSLLTSALEHGPSVKRIVITSSVGAVLTPPTGEPRVFSESDWNDDCIARIKNFGKDAPGSSKYAASKVLAERAAWDFWKVHRAEVGWDLAVVIPPMVFGPFMDQAGSIENMNFSARLWYKAVVNPKGIQIDLTTHHGIGYVDVRDLAEGQLRVFTMPEAGGERIIICASQYKWQDFVNLAHPLSPRIPAGDVTYDPARAIHLVQYTPDKERRILGIKYHTMAETTKDTIDDFKARSWL